MMDVFADIASHRKLIRQEFLRGNVKIDMASPVHDDNRKLRVLIQAVGWVGKAVSLVENNDCPAQREQLAFMLNQLAAQTVAWLEALE